MGQRRANGVSVAPIKVSINCIHHTQMNGTIISFGRRAATIQVESGQQFYAPCAQMSVFVIYDLISECVPLSVTFDVDTTRTEGDASGIPRYYAMNVEVRDIVVL